MAETSSLLPVDEVIETLLAAAEPIADIEIVTIEDCLGRVLAENLVSEVDVPPAANSQMDGYAVNVDDGRLAEGAEYQVSDRIPAGRVGNPLEPGTLARIFTGAPIPEGANAVVMQENTTLLADGRVRVNQVPRRDENIRPAGQDIPLGHKIALKDFKPGETVVKYGEDIGKVVAEIRAGEHVHVHNLKTKRW